LNQIFSERNLIMKTNKKFSKKIEVLAPVGGEEQLLAAVRCGADAVYFGLQNFNARRNASNFNGENLKASIDYCHERNVSVAITINTIVHDSEIEEMHKAVDEAALNGADALIIQDFAVARYVKDKWPDMTMRASTQMAVHNSEGIKILRDYGFSQFVLARELSLDEIKRIYDETGAYLESFVHGAHCMSVSGNCYMSSFIGCRSGNRGLCAQPCRLDWKLGDNDYALSLKDLSYIKSIKDLADAGVSSIKIEGRMKRPEYVAEAVRQCRNAVDGLDVQTDTLKAVFSRSGFTDGYLSGKRNHTMFGYRTKEDVVSAANVLPQLTKLYEKDPQTIPVDMFLYAYENDNSQLTVSCEDVSVTVIGDVPQLAKNLPLTEEYARKSLSKTGGTPYYLNELSLSVGDGLMLPASALNALRREALDKLREERLKQW